MGEVRSFPFSIREALLYGFGVLFILLVLVGIVMLAKFGWAAWVS